MTFRIDRMCLLAAVIFVVSLLPGCGSSSSSSSSSSGTDCSSTSLSSSDICSTWVLNTSGETAAIIKDQTTGVAAEVNVQSVTVDDSLTDVTVTSTDTPNYTHTVTAADITWLSSEYSASDYASGTYTVSSGGLVQWGTDIGFKPAGGTSGCKTTMGSTGWWPPYSQCYTTQSITAVFPVSPSAATGTCYTRESTMGLFADGTAVFNWSDGNNFDSSGAITSSTTSWHGVAAKLEAHGQDLCNGHDNASGEYHHHFNPVCLGDKLGDTGTGHSPIYGYAADGYPIYGPWYASGQKALSSWTARDYSSVATYGCATAGARTCVLKDPLNPSLGTTTTSVTTGPTTSGTVTGSDMHSQTASSGVFFEDYYYDSLLYGSAPQYLDEHNGHDHDGLGYHYHITESFPYTPGPSFYGTLDTTNGLVHACYTAAD